MNEQILEIQSIYKPFDHLMNPPFNNLTNIRGGKNLMKRKFIFAVVVMIMFISISQMWASDTSPVSSTQDYLIGPGDVLEISVWNNEALTKLVTVLPDGKIHFPLIGEVVVGGKTLTDLEKELKEKIGKYVTDTDLLVMVQQTGSFVIYVIGEVNRPGRFNLNTNINVLQALAMAGGFTEWAKKNKIKIFRETEDKTEVLKFSYDDIVKEKNINSNIKLKRGDTIFVPY
jgi:polysaccharide export outer membrane protein